MASRKEGSGSAGGGFAAAKGKGKAAAAGDSAVKQVQIDGLVSTGPGASSGRGWAGWPRGAGGRACPWGGAAAEPRVLPRPALPEGRERLPASAQLPGCGQASRARPW